MTETTAVCTDCEARVDVGELRQHMADMHGVMHAPYEKGPAVCPRCGAAPCERAERLLSGGGK